MVWESPPANDGQRAKFAYYAAALVETYKGKTHAWEVWNEPNIWFWSPPPNTAHYTKLLKAAYRAVKKVDPDCVVVGLITAGSDLDFIAQMLENGGGDSFDAISVHEYIFNEEDALPDMRAIRDLLKQYGLGKPIWNTEFGWSTGKYHSSGQKQAEKLVRMVTFCLSEGVERLFPYNLQDYASPETLDLTHGETSGEGRTGLFQYDNTPKASAVAYNQMIYLLDGAHYAKDLNLGQQMYRYLFARERKQVVVLFTTCTEEVPVEFTVGQPEVVVGDMRGRKRTVRPVKGKVRLILSESPQYLRPRASSLIEAELAKGAPKDVEFQQGVNPPRYDGRRDVSIQEYLLQRNPGGYLELEVGRYTGRNEADDKNILICFDLFSIPKTAKVIDAFLKLMLIATHSGSPAKKVAIYKLLRDWGEGKGLRREGQQAHTDDVCGSWAKYQQDKWGRVLANDKSDCERVYEHIETMGGLGIGTVYK